MPSFQCNDAINIHFQIDPFIPKSPDGFQKPELKDSEERKHLSSEENQGRCVNRSPPRGFWVKLI